MKGRRWDQAPQRRVIAPTAVQRVVPARVSLPTLSSQQLVAVYDQLFTMMFNEVRSVSS